MYYHFLICIPFYLFSLKTLRRANQWHLLLLFVHAYIEEKCFFIIAGIFIDKTKKGQTELLWECWIFSRKRFITEVSQSLKLHMKQFDHVTLTSVAYTVKLTKEMRIPLNSQNVIFIYIWICQYLLGKWRKNGYYNALTLLMKRNPLNLE